MSSTQSSSKNSFKDSGGGGGRLSRGSNVSMDLQERTLRVANYGRQVTESILRELFSQVNHNHHYLIV